MATDVRFLLFVDRVPDVELTGQVSEIEVSESVRNVTTARIRFPVDIAGTDFSFLSDDRLTPGTDTLISVVITVDTTPTVISQGLVTERRIEIEDGGAGSFLEITTMDRRIEMDRACLMGSAQNGPVFGIVMAILASYKFIPDVDPTFATLYLPFTQTLNQAGSDLALIQALAGQHGAEFWIDWLPVPGFPEVAHFKASPAAGLGPAPPVSVPLLGGSRELRMNAGATPATILKFSSHWISEAPNTSGSMSRVDLDSGSIQRGSVRSATVQRFGDEPDAPDIECQVLSPGDIAEAQRRQTAALNDASWVIRASVESSVHALGGLVRPHETIAVRGVGSRDSGDYFVDAVRHRLTPTDHLMSIDLKRNAISAGLGLPI